MESDVLLDIHQCSINLHGSSVFPPFSWRIHSGDSWIITGKNGSGKSTLAAALAGNGHFIPTEDGLFTNNCTLIKNVSFETAASLIEEEWKNDDSDFVEGGIDAGRTPATLLSPFPHGKKMAELCGILPVWNRGLKFLSTGEIRRTLLAEALASKPDILILDNPFDGLDTAAAKMLSTLIQTLVCQAPKTGQVIILVLDRYLAVPAGFTQVLELKNRESTFCGSRADFEKSLVAQPTERTAENLLSTEKADELITPRIPPNLQDTPQTNVPLIEMKNVTIEWSGNIVIDNLSWTVHHGEHWCIRGPNGSGKTSILELITGDNPQVFRNNVELFGRKRGSGETIWEIKEKLGIVSYRLHLEYRSLGDNSLENIIVSGFYDSIGLYQQCTEEQRHKAREWLELGGFTDKGKTLFRDLSYGEQRAVLILRAAVKLPALLILDEPCHGLDHEHRARTLALLQRIAEHGGSTLLHVTHDPEEVLPCERHILELRPGKNPSWAIIHNP